AWILGGILFCWQVPHFLALAWMYREDYERGGFRMLPAVDQSGSATAIVSLVYALALLPLGVFVALEGLAGTVFLITSVVLGIFFATAAWRMVSSRSAHTARRLFLTSLIYLPLLLGAMMIDTGRGSGRNVGGAGSEHATISTWQAHERIR
ncbi:MAG: UbiA family prenyltransferase, partial [bacterium]|nr:UbiA family prenyltransferase [bacterium]